MNNLPERTAPRKLVARKCAYCGHGKGTTAFRYDRDGKTERDYFHPGCFSTFLVELEGIQA